MTKKQKRSSRKRMAMRNKGLFNGMHRMNGHDPMLGVARTGMSRVMGAVAALFARTNSTRTS